jgi:hypothetical protein
MFSFTEMQGQSSLLHKSGTVEINTDCYRHRRPAWLVMLKLLGVAAMVAVGYAIALPSLLQFEFPLWQAIAVTAGVMLFYTIIAFFIRPEANTDNMGWGGGMANDPFQASDNVNRFLWKAHCVLGPGRFTAETFLDTCVLFGLIGCGEATAAPACSQGSLPGYAAASDGNSFDATRPIAPLDPNRFALSSANSVTERIQQDSQRYATPAPRNGS